MRVVRMSTFTSWALSWRRIRSRTTHRAPSASLTVTTTAGGNTDSSTSRTHSFVLYFSLPLSIAGADVAAGWVSASRLCPRCWWPCSGRSAAYISHPSSRCMRMWLIPSSGARHEGPPQRLQELPCSRIHVQSSPLPLCVALVLRCVSLCSRLRETDRRSAGLRSSTCSHSSSRTASTLRRTKTNSLTRSPNSLDAVCLPFPSVPSVCVSSAMMAEHKRRRGEPKLRAQGRPERRSLLLLRYHRRHAGHHRTSLSLRMLSTDVSADLCAVQ